MSCAKALTNKFAMANKTIFKGYTMTKIQFKLSQIVLALVVAFGAITFIACGEGGSKVSKNASKAPKIMKEFNSNPFFGAYHSFYAVSQDDDTIIKGATISGRNGKCKTQTAVMLMRYDSRVRLFDSMSSCQAEQDDFWDCKPLFDGEKLFYGSKKIIYEPKYEECPPKNGVWYVKLNTNFGTFEYEVPDNR